MTNKPLSLLPHVSFAILFALSLRPRHGYEIMQQVATDSDGRTTLGAGALYSTIKKLVADNYIEEILSTSEHDRRRQYRLTLLGWDRLSKELVYYSRITEIAASRVVPLT